VAQPTPKLQEFPSILPGESLAKYQKSAHSPMVTEGEVENKPTVVGGTGELAESSVVALEDPESTEAPHETEETLPIGVPERRSEPVPDTLPKDVETTQLVTDFPSRDLIAEREVSAERPEGERPKSLSTLADLSQIPTLETSPPEILPIESPTQEKSPGSFLISSSETKESAKPLQDNISGKTTQRQSPITPTVGETPVVASTSPLLTKAQFRNSPSTTKFFRRNMDKRRRQQNYNEDRNEWEGTADFPLIGDLLKESQEILVQISKEPLGTKGARITSHIALPGRYLVYMPTVDHIGVSRKIESDDERQRLKRIIQENKGGLPGGFIVRTAGQNKGEDEFKSDIKYLSALWAEIRSKSEKKSAPAVIHRDLNLIQRLLRDQLSGDFSAIRVDNEIEYTGIVEFINRFQPSLVNRVRLYTKEAPIFEEFGVQEEIDRALRSKVWLKSGGYIVIDQAEALVAIDVNTGKYVGKSNKLEDTIVKTNIEAAKEIAHQIRLRDLGGIIVCDFIDMEDRKNRQKVTQTLEEALRSDKSPSKILQFNDFGLVAITRKRVKQSLLKVLCEPCSECGGSGMVKSPQTICYEIQGEVKKMARFLENKEITLRVHPEVAKVLKTNEASVINEIESSLKKEVIIKSDPLLHQEHFDIF
jgi:ribonuclease G